MSILIALKMTKVAWLKYWQYKNTNNKLIIENYFFSVDNGRHISFNMYVRITTLKAALFEGLIFSLFSWTFLTQEI